MVAPVMVLLASVVDLVGMENKTLFRVPLIYAAPWPPIPAHTRGGLDPLHVGVPAQ